MRNPLKDRMFWIFVALAVAIIAIVAVRWSLAS